MNRKIFYIFIIIFLMVFSAQTCFSATPKLTNKAVGKQIKEILQNHVNYKRLDSELMERVLRNFLEELDPSKTYFTIEDITPWYYPTEETKEKFLSCYKSLDFKPFHEIHSKMLAAIKRQSELNKNLKAPKETDVIDKEEFSELNWAENEKMLMQRLQKIHSLQTETAKKYYSSDTNQFHKIIEKRRKNREKELSSSNINYFINSLILKATASALDAHTNYFTPQEAKQFMIDVQRRMFGIGALLKDNLNGFSIKRIVDGSPADRSKKLKINDLIIAVDNKPIIGMEIFDAVELIRGEKGSKVKLTIVREDKEKNKSTFDIEIERGEIVLEESRIESHFEPYADGNIGYIRLFSFYQDPSSSSASDMKKAILQIQENGNLKGIVLDLRDNSGGALSQAVDVCSLFITKGIVVSIKDNSGIVRHLRDTEGKQLYDGPLIILCNKASASASEIVAQTLQDYGRAIIVGDSKTFGKGSFQTFSLDPSDKPKANNMGEYKVTKGLYYTVSGKSPQLVGVKADITVPSILSELDVGEEFSKYPLKNESIPSNFVDDLSDVPMPYKTKIGIFYRHNLQQKISCFTKYINKIKINSEKRIEQNTNYQNFLNEIKKKNYDDPTIELFNQAEIQLTEAKNILKDLIYLVEIGDKN